MPSPQTVILIRHGEKPHEGGVPHGVNSHGEHDGHSLSVRGWTRAGALAAMFAHAPHALHPALVTPQRVYATKPTHTAKSTRELDTATPTARRLGLEVDDSVSHGKEVELAQRILGSPDDALVVWHHGRIVLLAHEFPLVNPDEVPDEWPDHRFDLYWILTREDDSDVPAYRFSVLAQNLLDGDESV